jgi:hypothetical protein
MLFYLQVYNSVYFQLRILFYLQLYNFVHFQMWILFFLHIYNSVYFIYRFIILFILNWECYFVYRFIIPFVLNWECYFIYRFIILFVLMSCFGGCGYYKQRQRIIHGRSSSPSHTNRRSRTIILTNTTEAVTPYAYSGPGAEPYNNVFQPPPYSEVIHI